MQRSLLNILSFTVGFLLVVFIFFPSVSSAENWYLGSSVYKNGGTCGIRVNNTYYDSGEIIEGDSDNYVFPTSYYNDEYHTGGYNNFSVGTYYKSYTYESQNKCYVIYSTNYEPPPPWEPNGVMDGDETGVDCGGSTGVECEYKCPDGYVLIDNTCFKDAGFEGPDPDTGETVPYVNPALQATPLSAAPDYEPTESDWEPILSSVPESPTLAVDTVPLSTTGNPLNGDYVIRDADGNIVAAKVTGSGTTTDNGDGTSTTIMPVTTVNSGTGQNQTTVGTVTTDNNTGAVLGSTQTTTGNTGTTSGAAKLVGVGLGSSGNVTGDEYARGIDQILSALDGTPESEGDTGGFTSPSESSFEIDDLDAADYDTEGLVAGYISEYSNAGWLSLFSGSSIAATSSNCSIDGDISLKDQSVPVSFSMCDFESTFSTMGALFAALAQLTALFIVFGGFD
jgi:hypothetical protein